MLCPCLVTFLLTRAFLLTLIFTSISASAFGRRLVSAGRRFQSMGQYGQGELQRIAKAMIMSGNFLAANSGSTATSEEPKNKTRILK
ncbi:hypothetical protein U1Q18_043034, partial [Sarracenia purpurea var. burkii]